MATMPFTPCPATGACTDTSVGILTRIFGPVITSMTQGLDPTAVSSAGNLLPTLFTYFNSGILVIGSLIVSFIAVVGAANTANDGEVLGKAWSSMWTPIRIVFSGGMLLPTTSGYSFFQLVTLLISLWAVGFGNGVYNLGTTFAIFTPPDLVYTPNSASDFYGVRDFGAKYLKMAMCERSANAIFRNPVSNPDVSFDHGLTIAGADKVESKGGLTTYTYDVKDRNAVSNLGGGDPICGQLSINVYTGATSTAGLSAEAIALDGTRVIVSSAKATAVRSMVASIDNWIATAPFPLDANRDGWDAVNSATFNAIVNVAERDVLANIGTAMVNAQSSMAAGVLNPGGANMLAYFDRGWAEAGGWWQKTATLRTEAAEIVQEAVGDVSSPPLSGMPGDGRTDLLRSTVDIADAILRRSQAHGNYQATAIPRPEDVASVLPDSGATSIDASTLNAELNKKFSSIMNNATAAIVGYATGTGATAGVHPIDRMKMVGDSLAATKTVLRSALFTLQAGLTAVRTVAAGVSAGKVLGSGLDADKLFTPFWDFLTTAIGPLIADALTWVDVLIYYFSVMLPSLPYVIFMTAVVGWVLAVLQSTIAGPLWLIMHMRPSQTFVGSDAQGYTLLLALFVRPALAVVGLFAAFLASDPILDYVSQGFFQIRGAVNSDTGIIGWLAAWTTFKMWLGAWALCTLPIAYMLFGLSQTLPDHVLKWISAGVHDLGATNASAEAQRGLGDAASRYRASAAKSIEGRRHLPPPRGGQSGGSGPARLPGGGGTAAARDSRVALNANPQGAIGHAEEPTLGAGPPASTSGVGGSKPLSANAQGRVGATSAEARRSVRAGSPASGRSQPAGVADTVGFGVGVATLAARGRLPTSSVAGGSSTVMQRIGEASAGGSARAIRKLSVDHRRALGPSGRASAAGRPWPPASPLSGDAENRAPVVAQEIPSSTQPLPSSSNQSSPSPPDESRPEGASPRVAQPGARGAGLV